MGARWPSGLDRALAWPWAGDRTLSRNPAAATSLRNFPSLAIPFTPLCQCLSEETLKAVAHDQSLLSGVYIGFTVTSYAVSRGHPAPLVGKRFLAGGLHVTCIFAWIHALFALLILLTHKIMIMFCI